MAREKLTANVINQARALLVQQTLLTRVTETTKALQEDYVDLLEKAADFLNVDPIQIRNGLGWGESLAGGEVQLYSQLPILSYSLHSVSNLMQVVFAEEIQAMTHAVCPSISYGTSIGVTLNRELPYFLTKFLQQAQQRLKSCVPPGTEIRARDRQLDQFVAANKPAFLDLQICIEDMNQVISDVTKLEDAITEAVGNKRVRHAVETAVPALAPFIVEALALHPSKPDEPNVDELISCLREGDCK